MKLISLTNISADKFDLVLKVDDSTKKMQISILERDGVVGIEGSAFEEQLWRSGSAKANQKLIAEIKTRLADLKKHSELQAA